MEIRALKSWMLLNDDLRGADEERCQMLLNAELADKKRRQFVMRIHSRLNKVRADRERKDLEEEITRG